MKEFPFIISDIIENEFGEVCVLNHISAAKGHHFLAHSINGDYTKEIPLGFILHNNLAKPLFRQHIDNEINYYFIEGNKRIYTKDFYCQRFAVDNKVVYNHKNYLCYVLICKSNNALEHLLYLQSGIKINEKGILITKNKEHQFIPLDFDASNPLISDNKIYFSNKKTLFIEELTI